MNADGTGQRRLIRNGIGPRWSRTGRTIRVHPRCRRAPGCSGGTYGSPTPTEAASGTSRTDRLADAELVGWSAAQRDGEPRRLHPVRTARVRWIAPA